VPMAGRLLTLTPGFARARSRLGIHTGSERAQALAACLSWLASARTLPGALDFEAEFKPGTAHVRRARGSNLWVWYRFGEGSVTILSVTNTPPVPLTE